MKQVAIATPVVYTLINARPEYRSVSPDVFTDIVAEQMTIKEAESRYKNFQWRGPGWYEGEAYTLAVIPSMGVNWSKAEGSGMDAFCPLARESRGERFSSAPFGPGHSVEDQLWTFIAFPDALNLDYNPITELFKHMANMPVQSERPRQHLNSLPEEEIHDAPNPGPVVIQVPPGGVVRVEPKDTDGAFVISYDVDGNGLLVVDTDYPGSVMGKSGPIYVEDFNRDFTGRTDTAKVARVHGYEPEKVESPRLDLSESIPPDAQARKRAILDRLVEEFNIQTDIAMTAADITESNAGGAYAMARRAAIEWFRQRVDTFDQRTYGAARKDAAWEVELKEHVRAAVGRLINVTTEAQRLEMLAEEAKGKPFDATAEAERRANAAEAKLQAQYPLPAVPHGQPKTLYKRNDQDELSWAGRFGSAKKGEKGTT